MDWQLAPDSTATAAPPLRSSLAQSLAANAMADALPLFEALARGDSCTQGLPLSATLGLQLRLTPLGA